MIKGIDHLVVVVPDLETAIMDYSRAGFTVVRGGHHPGGTHNALIAFADGAYVELLAFAGPSEGHPWFEALKQGGGLTDFCAQTDDLAADLAAFRRAGAELSDPMPLSRERPDGYRLSWTLAIPQPPLNRVVPFLIKDQTPRAERVPRDHSHPNGTAGIRNLTIAVEDLDAPAACFAGVLGREGERCAQPEIEAEGLRFAFGPHEIRLMKPRASSSPLAGWLRARGPGPFEAALNFRPGGGPPIGSEVVEGSRLRAAG